MLEPGERLLVAETVRWIQRINVKRVMGEYLGKKLLSRAGFVLHDTVEEKNTLPWPILAVCLSIPSKLFEDSILCLGLCFLISLFS